MKMYQDEDGRLWSIGQLWDEFEDLKEIDPETYDYSFEQYIENCTSKNGSLTIVEANWFSYETLWANVREALIKHLDVAGIPYKVNVRSDKMFSHFEILATPEMLEDIKSFLKEAA